MQLYAGRSADQWRGFAALDPRGSEQPFAWHDSTGGHAACRHQHRSDNGRDADAKYIGLRREHDDESGDARHDGAGQRHGCRGNAGCIAGIPIGLLRGKRRFPTPWRKTAGAAPDDDGAASNRLERRANPKTLFNGGTGSASLCFSGAAPPRLPPEAVFRWPQSGRRTPILCPRMRRAALSGSLSNGETDSRTAFLAFAGR